VIIGVGVTTLTQGGGGEVETPPPCGPKPCSPATCAPVECIPVQCMPNPCSPNSPSTGKEGEGEKPPCAPDTPCVPNPCQPDSTLPCGPQCSPVTGVCAPDETCSPQPCAPPSTHGQSGKKCLVKVKTNPNGGYVFFYVNGSWQSVYDGGYIYLPNPGPYMIKAGFSDWPSGSGQGAIFQGWDGSQFAQYLSLPGGNQESTTLQVNGGNTSTCGTLILRWR
jgi:hypothetical protein